MASRRGRRIEKEFEDFVQRVMRRLILRLYQALTLATPVATGFARAGWVVSKGAAQPGPSHGPLSGRGAVVDLMVAQQRLATALFGENQQKANDFARGYKVRDGLGYIVNNVFYVKFLNEGSSAQAGAFFIEESITNAVIATSREFAA